MLKLHLNVKKILQMLQQTFFLLLNVSFPPASSSLSSSLSLSLFFRGGGGAGCAPAWIRPCSPKLFLKIISLPFWQKKAITIYWWRHLNRRCSNRTKGTTGEPRTNLETKLFVENISCSLKKILWNLNLCRKNCHCTCTVNSLYVFKKWNPK